MSQDQSLPKSESRNMAVIGHCDLEGSGDGMHVNVAGDIAYVGHMGEGRVGTSVVDVSDPRHPTVITQIDTPIGTHSHKVQVVEDLLAVNYERNAREPQAESWRAGLQLFNVGQPASPRPLGFLPTPGKGVHRMTFWEPPYVTMSASQPGFTDQLLLVADISDPEHPVQVARWWVPGMHAESGEVPDWDTEVSTYKAHHCLTRGDRGYVSWWDAGFMIFDIAEVTQPRLVSHNLPTGPTSQTHTTLPVPGRDLLVVAEEATKDNCGEPDRNIFIYDIANEKAPSLLSILPRPIGDFCERGGRFGPHNLHEGRPGSLVSSDLLFATYFNAGVRAYDIGDPTAPTETGFCIPEPPPGQAAIQMNDLTVTPDGLVFATDRVRGGLYVMEYSG